MINNTDSRQPTGPVTSSSWRETSTSDLEIFCNEKFISLREVIFYPCVLCLEYDPRYKCGVLTCKSIKFWTIIFHYFNTEQERVGPDDQTNVRTRLNRSLIKQFRLQKCIAIDRKCPLTSEINSSGTLDLKINILSALDLRTKPTDLEHLSLGLVRRKI